VRIQDTPPLTDIAHPYSSRTRWSHNDRHHRRIVVPVVTVAAFLVQLGGLSLQAAATPAFVQSAVAARTSSGGALATPARTTTTGNLFVVAVSWDDGTGTTVTVTDNKGNAYASATSKQLDTRHNQALQVFYATNGLGGANHTFTATPSRTATSMRLVVHEVSGVSGSNALDGAAVVNDEAGVQVSVGPVTTTTNGDYIFAVAMNDSGNTSFAPTIGNGFTERATAAPAKSEMQTQDTIKATAGSIAATWTMSRTNDAMAQQVAFKPGLTLPSDTTPPTPPANLVVGTVTQTQVNLSWTASTDNVGVTGYRVYRNTAQSGTTTALSYQDTGLTSATSYTYEVAAVDAAGNVSARSAAVVATTQSPAPDTQAPTAPAN